MPECAVVHLADDGSDFVVRLALSPQESRSRDAALSVVHVAIEGSRYDEIAAISTPAEFARNLTSPWRV